MLLIQDQLRLGPAHTRMGVGTEPSIAGFREILVLLTTHDVSSTGLAILGLTSSRPKGRKMTGPGGVTLFNLFSPGTFDKSWGGRL